MARISLPSSLSIAVYAGTYTALLALVLSRLGSAEVAGLGIGFQVFEGVAFPCYLGVSVAAASLVGRALGAQDRDEAWRVVRTARATGWVLGGAFLLLFLVGNAWLVPWFAEDADVVAATRVYVFALAFSQCHVAVEAVNEKVLLGAGHTRPLFWIGAAGNLMRLPLAWLLAFSLGWGALGVWWAINLTTFGKAYLLWRRVQAETWLDEGLRRAAPAA